MRNLFLVLILMLGFGVFQQATAQKAQNVSVLINKQKIAVKNKLTIKFVSLIEDSRCPTDVQCIQAGTARITVRVSGAKSGGSGGAAQTFELATGGRGQAASYNGYSIKLIDLNPKPASNIRINRNGYTAIFQITRQK